MFGKYYDFYKANVESVERLLDICNKAKKDFIYISTISIAGINNVNKILDEDALVIGQELSKNPYLMSKYEAELRIIDEINNNNLNARIFRIGNIMPRLTDLKFNKNFNDNTFLLALKELIVINQKTKTLEDKEISLTPVDQCAESIVGLLSNKCDKIISHIENVNKIKIKDILICKGIENIQEVPHEIMMEKIKSRYNIGSQYLKMYLESDIFKNYSTRITNEKLNNIGFKWYKITDKYIKGLLDILNKM